MARAGILATLATGLVTGPATPAGAVAESGDQPVIVATMSIWADIVNQLDCGDTFDVQTLIAPGGDPHSYEPSMRDRETLDDAALVVANGAGLEASLTDTLDAVADDGTAMYVVADHVTTHPMDQPGDEHDAAGDNGDDPHLWFDPTLVIESLASMGRALVGAGADSATIDGCVDDLTTSLTSLDADVANILGAVPDDERLLVTNHDALGYFARHYGFEVLGSVLPSSSTLVEASPSELEDLANAIDATGVPAIFAEALETTDDASTLADRLGVDVVTLYTDSLGDDDSGVTTYDDLMRFDATAIADALAG